MSNILRFEQFNESLQPMNESGIPVYVGTGVNPEKTIKRNTLILELMGLINEVNAGKLSEVSILADVPTQGRNAPQYLKDIYAEAGTGNVSDEDDMYDPETDVYTGDRNPADKSIFVDSEFIVKDVNIETNMIIATPYSLKAKGTLVEIHPDVVEEVFIK
jgi:hypothetical protein